MGFRSKALVSCFLLRVLTCGSSLGCLPLGLSQLCRSVDSAVMLTGQHNQPCGTVNTPAGSTSQQSTGRHNQHSVGTINPLAPSLVWPSQHCGTLNPPAQATLRPSQHCGTIIISAQSPFWLNIAVESALRHNQPFGTFIILAQSTFRHSQHSGTVNIPAQSTIRHHHHCSTRCWKHPDTPLHNSMIDAVNYGT